MSIESTPIALGAGPGATKTYQVDLPFPWGDNTSVTLPVQQLSYDFADAAWPVLYSRVEHALPELYQSRVKPYLSESAKEFQAIGTQLLVGVAFIAGASLLGYAWIRRQGR